MAKKKDDAPADDVQPVEGTVAEIDPKDAEIERLRAELAAAKAGGGVVYQAGKKYKVELPDAGTAIVEVKAGEHPWDVFCRCTGIIASVHRPSITEAPDDATCGHVRANGEVQPFAPEHTSVA